MQPVAQPPRSKPVKPSINERNDQKLDYHYLALVAATSFYWIVRAVLWAKHTSQQYYQARQEAIAREDAAVAAINAISGTILDNALSARFVLLGCGLEGMSEKVTSCYQERLFSVIHKIQAYPSDCVFWPARSVCVFHPIHRRFLDCFKDIPRIPCDPGIDLLKELQQASAE